LADLVHGSNTALVEDITGRNTSGQSSLNLTGSFGGIAFHHGSVNCFNTHCYLLNLIMNDLNI